jgi:hypothetical protein
MRGYLIMEATMVKPALLAALALLLAGCAEAEWRNPNVPEDQWSADMRGCHGAAYGEARSQADRLASPSWNNSGDRFDQDRLRMRQDMDRERQSQIETRAFDACMTARGYSRVAP